MKFISKSILGLSAWLITSMFVSESLAVSGPAFLEFRKINCIYMFTGLEFAQIEIGMDENGFAENQVKVTHSGVSHSESFSQVENESADLLRGWISKESPDNAVELVIYRELQEKGQSKLVNHKMPFAKEIWGTCQFK